MTKLSFPNRSTIIVYFFSSKTYTFSHQKTNPDHYLIATLIIPRMLHLADLLGFALQILIG
jgi:hypothetical protein